MIKKVTSIKVSQKVFNLVLEELNYDIVENNVKIDGWLETFYNGREQGFVLNVISCNPEKNLHLKVWVCERRNSDNIFVAMDKTYSCLEGNSYSQNAYENATLFESSQIQDSANFIVEKVKTMFKSEYNK